MIHAPWDFEAARRRKMKDRASDEANESAFTQPVAPVIYGAEGAGSVELSLRLMLLGRRGGIGALSAVDVAFFQTYTATCRL